MKGIKILKYLPEIGSTSCSFAIPIQITNFVALFSYKVTNQLNKYKMIKVNEYFDGKVKSLAVENAEGSSTVGVIAPGEYEFGTGTVEIMNIVSGELEALLPGEKEWKNYKKGTSFRVEKGVKFKVKAKQTMAYLCQYL